MEVDVKVFGDKEISKVLNELSARNLDKVVRPAVNKALTPLNKEAKRRCPKDTGALKRSIGKKIKKYKMSGSIWGAVGIRTGSKYIKEKDGKKRNPVKYAHLVEFGHIGKKPAPPHPFLRPAFDVTKGQMWSILQDTIRERLAKLIREVRK